MWDPQPGAQTSFLLADWCDEIFFGGERGGGKSDAQCGYQEDGALRYRDKWRGIMFRKTYPELEELQARASEIFPGEGAVYKSQSSAEHPFSNCWYWPSGATVKMRYIETEKDYGRYHGHQYTGISFDEVTEYHTPSGLLKMLSTLRSAFGVPCTMRATGNPGGVGHGWVKQRYIENVPPYHPFKDPDTGFIRMFIPSKTTDNQILLRADPHYQQRIRAATGGNEVLRKAWLEGDWNIVAGAFFSEWNSSRHVIKPFSIPIHWTRYRAFDWGSAKPFACYWIAVSDGSMPAFPRGALIVYREYYGMQSGHPNVGLKMTADAVAREIIRMDGKETTHDTGWGVADPAIFTEDGGPSIAEMMRREGLRWRRADNKRRPGWEQMRIRLSCDDDGLPLLVIFDTCVHLIRTLPTLQHDDHNPEDIDTDQEDHAGDALRYGVMARPIIRSERPKEDGPRPGTAEHMMMITDAPKEISKYRSIRRK
jgi:hypothetical protein